MKRIHLLLAAVLLCISACNKSEVQYRIDKLSGIVQKGPYVNGTAITISELNEYLNPTGKTFQTQIADNKGSFVINGVELESPYVEIRADGFYFNELSGEMSSAQLTLFGLADISDQNTVNVNILTQLEKGRVEYLISEGEDFAEAKSQAQQEVLNIFGIHHENMSGSEFLDISKQEEENAILLAISLIVQGDLGVGDLTEFLANINTDIREDGVLNSEILESKLISQAAKLDHTEIRDNLDERFSEMGVSATIPAFESYVNTFRTNGLDFTLLETDVSCNGLSDGAINISVSAGTPPYSFSWSNGETTEDLSRLAAGSYSLTITDAMQGVFEISDILIEEPDAIIANPIVTTTLADQSDGSIDLQVTGGTPPYAYAWTHGASTEDLSNLAVGKYQVNISDANACQISTTVNVGGYIIDDRDEAVYKVVGIGEQIWMAENLNFGSWIESSQRSTDNGIVEKYYLADSAENEDVFGGLYEWPEMMDYGSAEGSQGICPDGWHIPTDQDWKDLELHLGGIQEDVDAIGWEYRCAGVGDMIKTPDKCTSMENCGSTGFDLLLGGRLAYVDDSTMEYRYTRFLGEYWSSTEVVPDTVFLRSVCVDRSGVARIPEWIYHAMYVRCLKD